MPITIPAPWRETLRRVQLSGHPEAIIAGGALRDLTHSRPVKDVDIFLTYSPSKTARCIAETFGPYRHTVPSNVCEYTNSMTDVYTVYEAKKDGVDYNLIALDRPMSFEEVIDRLDFGICRIGYNGSLTYAPGEFVQDVRAQTFTLLRCENADQYGRSMARYTRLQEKYPNHKLVVPEPFLSEYALVLNGEVVPV